MKDDAKIYQDAKEVSIGDKLVCVVVSKTEHGCVTKTFGGIKGLLTFADIEEKLGSDYDRKQFKKGSIIKSYCLFKKKEKGLALTLNKKKLKKLESIEGTLEAAQLPTEIEAKELMNESDKATQDLVGSVHKFKITSQSNGKYLIVKSIEKKSNSSFTAVVPACLASDEQVDLAKFAKKQGEELRKGLVLNLVHGCIPLVSFKEELASKKEAIFNKHEEELL